MSDRVLLCLSSLLRSLAIGMLGVLIALHFISHHWSDRLLFEVVASGLAGGALASGLAAFVADHGRRRWLSVLSALSAGGVAVCAFAPDESWMLVAAFVGMLNGMGKDRSAQQVIETAILPATATAAERTLVIARYSMLQDIGLAVGTLAAGLPKILAPATGGSGTGASLMIAAGLLACGVVIPLFLSSAVEIPRPPVAMRLSPASRGVLWRLCGLFSLDSLGGGFITGSLVTFFFIKQFDQSAVVVGSLLFLARCANAVSHLGAAWLAKRIGLVNTMVFTHIPSSLLLVTVGFTGSFWVAAVLYLLRESLVEMDVPTRQSYVMAVVRPEERTFVSAVTSLVRLGGWAVGAAIAGAVLALPHVGLAMPLIACAALKITYDILLYWNFRHVKPPEEQVAAQVTVPAVT
ncbi:MAG: MFS transporter [Planctomycetes bacterium]|nr:MFS transporter [Planctomycetota bacterium]